jgi:hypothetical protein
MKFREILAIGLLTMIIGIPIIIVISTLLGGHTGDGPINSTIFNVGVTGIIGAILLLISVVIVCTIYILRAIKSLAK